LRYGVGKVFGGTQRLTESLTHKLNHGQTNLNTEVPPALAPNFYAFPIVLTIAEA